jgi:hypothetical protein
MLASAHTAANTKAVAHYSVRLICIVAVSTDIADGMRKIMDLLLVLIVLLLLFGGGGAFYWGIGAGCGIGPVGLILAVVLIAFMLHGFRGRRGQVNRIRFGPTCSPAYGHGLCIRDFIAA